MVAVCVLVNLRVNHLEKFLHSAYKEIHCSNTAVTQVDNDVRQKIVKNCCVVPILLNLSSVFDTVDTILYRRDSFILLVLRGEYWTSFRSYLENHTYFVKLDYTISTMCALDCGTNQGSVLGPPLYLLCIAPLGDILCKYSSSFCLYADNQLAAIQDCLTDICNWMTINKWI